MKKTCWHQSDSALKTLSVDRMQRWNSTLGTHHSTIHLKVVTWLLVRRLRTVSSILLCQVSVLGFLWLSAVVSGCCQACPKQMNFCKQAELRPVRRKHQMLHLQSLSRWVYETRWVDRFEQSFQNHLSVRPSDPLEPPPFLNRTLHCMTTAVRELNTAVSHGVLCTFHVARRFLCTVVISSVSFQPSRELAEQTFNQIKLFKKHLSSPSIRYERRSLLQEQLCAAHKSWVSYVCNIMPCWRRVDRNFLRSLCSSHSWKLPASAFC